MLRYQGRLLSGIPTRCCKCIRYTHTGVSLDIIRYPTSNELRCACRGQAERFDKIERSWSLQGNERHVLMSVLCTFRKQVRCFDGVQCTSFGTTSNCAITARSWSVPLGWPIATDQNAEGSRDAFHKCSHWPCLPLEALGPSAGWAPAPLGDGNSAARNVSLDLTVHSVLTARRDIQPHPDGHFCRKKRKHVVRILLNVITTKQLDQFRKEQPLH